MNIPHLAYKFRLDYQIFNMPLDYDHLVYVPQRHFRILKYSEVQTELIQRECFSYTLELSGFALTDEFGQTTIYISDYVNREEQLSVLLHELGHVLCGHCRRMGPVGYGGDGDPAQEEEANEFALNVRAPVCYLAKLHVQSPEDIRVITGVGEEDAQHLYEEILKYRKEAHLVTRQEKSLIKMMNGTGERPSFHPGQKYLKNVAAVAFIALALIVGICCCAPYFSENENLSTFSYGSGESYGGSVPQASAGSTLSRPGGDSEPVSALVPDSGSPQEERDLAAEIEASKGAQALETFWVTRFGECYHRENCYHLIGKDNLREIIRQDATDVGLRPCKDCRPDDK